MTDPYLVDPDAFTFWVRAQLYSKLHNLDGLVPKAAFPIIGVGIRSVKKVVETLIEMQLICKTNAAETLLICNWNDMQTSREEIEEKREQARIRKQNQRNRENVTPLSRVTSRDSHETRVKSKEIYKESKSVTLDPEDDSKIPFDEFWSTVQGSYPSRGQGEADSTSSAKSICLDLWRNSECEELEDFLGAIKFLDRWASWKEKDDKSWNRRFCPSLSTWMAQKADRGGWLDLSRMAPKDSKNLQTVDGYGPNLRLVEPKAFIARAPVEGLDFEFCHGRMIDLGTNEEWDESAWLYRQQVIFRSESA